ncbi:hypothetical protein ABZS98_25890 [Streptomyces avermitilis]|uniref:hypothetical protein n=1 Tax=Streptomyces avermitilis TaxID=33903 RepID=UPI0033B04FB4
MPLPDSVTGRGLEGTDGWAILESVGREVFTVMRGDVGADYAELFEEFREDPQSVVRPLSSRPVLRSMPHNCWRNTATSSAAGQNACEARCVSGVTA